MVLDRLKKEYICKSLIDEYQYQKLWHIRPENISQNVTHVINFKTVKFFCYKSAQQFDIMPEAEYERFWF